MPDLFELKNMPEAYICTSPKGADELLGSTENIKSSKDFILLFNANKNTEEKLLPAYFNACVRYSSGIAKSRSAKLEMLMYVYSTANLKKALSEFTKNNSDKFIVFATCQKSLDEFLHKTGSKKSKKLQLLFKFDSAKRIAELKA